MGWCRDLPNFRDALNMQRARLVRLPCVAGARGGLAELVEAKLRGSIAGHTFNPIAHRSCDKFAVTGITYI
jgi:hypothetical protein